MPAVGGNAARWINHACNPNCESSRRRRRPRLHQGAAQHQAGRGAVLRLRPRARRALHPESEETVRLPLRRPRLPWHDARAQALTPLGWPTATASHPSPARRIDPLAHRGPVERAVGAAARPVDRGGGALRVDQHRAGGARAPLRRRPTRRHRAPVSSSRRSAARCPLPATTPLGRRAGDTQPCLLVAEQQTRGRGRWGAQLAVDAGASLTCSLALPFTPPDWSGLSLAIGVALAEALDPDGVRAAPHVALKWPNDLMGSMAGPRAQARRHPDRIGAGRPAPHGSDRRGPQCVRAAGQRAAAPASHACRS